MRRSRPWYSRHHVAEAPEHWYPNNNLGSGLVSRTPRASCPYATHTLTHTPRERRVVCVTAGVARLAEITHLGDTAPGLIRTWALARDTSSASRAATTSIRRAIVSTRMDG